MLPLPPEPVLAPVLLLLPVPVLPPALKVVEQTRVVRHMVRQLVQQAARRVVRQPM